MLMGDVSNCAFARRIIDTIPNLDFLWLIVRHCHLLRQVSVDRYDVQPVVKAVVEVRVQMTGKPHGHLILTVVPAEIQTRALSLTSTLVADYVRA